MKNSPVIELQNISKYYKTGNQKLQVLSEVSLSFDIGCFAVIAGPSGSGKSTLLNILGCLDRPQSGEYTLNGQLVNFNEKSKLSELRKDNFGFIFQSFNLIPVLTALENVALPLSLFKISNEEMEERSSNMLKLVGLESKLNNKPSELSGGEQQRVAIARAMVTRPKIIFADEPTANLDRITAKKIIRLMLDLNSENGVSFVFSSHDNLVVEAAKTLYKIELGKIIRSTLN